MEKGVGVWVREGEGSEWQHAIVVNLTEPTNGAPNSPVRDIRLRMQTGPMARTERVVSIDVVALENEQTDDFKLANSHDMDLVDDLIQLPNLHEPGICRTLSERFKINEIYTLTGEVLLAVNPFKNIGIYTDKIMRKYIRNGDKRSVGVEVPDMPPHVYGTADKAYRALMDPLVRNSFGNSDQSILVSGESGAGKTESTKFIMKYLATISDRKDTSRTSRSSRASIQEDDGHVIQQVLSSNPILESFGNARTIRNDNSSRFGKFIKMQFNENGRLTGASIQTYLLEKVRLAYQAEAERNFHVFYEMLAGASSVERERWNLMQPCDYHYLNQSMCVQRKDGVNDAEQFRVLKSALQTMGFADDNIESIFLMTAMLLHLGNLDFEPQTQGQGNDGSQIADSCDKSLQVVLDYMEIDKEGLHQAMCFRKISARDETYSISITPEAAENSRDALARFLYGKLFDWLVSRINDMMSAKIEAPQHGRGGFIGLLDIFGFEDLAHNSFEQLCINYANETLQQHFNRTVLRLEQEIYEREQIEWSFINFPDNSACIELIEGKPYGILTALDEECIVPQGNDNNFARKLYRQHSGHEHFSADKTEQANFVFVVHHYAGAVAYDSFGFCEKNKDVLFTELTNLVMFSSKAFLHNLLTELPASAATSSAPTSRTGSVERSRAFSQRSSAASDARRRSSAVSSRVSLGSQFRMQLHQLIETVGVTSCHYVRCLKPNDEARPATFAPMRVCDQLKAGGVLEAVRVNRAGYPVRIPHMQFIKRYRPLAPGSLLRRIPDAAGSDEHFDEETRQDCCRQLATFLLDGLNQRYPQEAKAPASNLTTKAVAVIQVGVSMVFFRRAAIQFAEAQLAKRYGEFVVLIQARVRCFMLTRRYQRMKKSIVVLQRVVRGAIARKQFKKLREAYRRQQHALQKERERKAAEEAKAARAAERVRAASEARAAKEAQAAVEAEAVAKARAQAEAKKAAEEEALRRTSRTTASSDPASDDSNEGENGRTTERMTSRKTRGTARFRFTKEYAHDSTQRETGAGARGTGIPRSVAMDPGDTVLHVAANCCNEHDVLKLLQNGSDINARNDRGRTPLHTAALHHNSEVVGILIDWEADVCAQDDDGNTPLHLTTDAQIANMLLEAGCTPNIVNGDGRTPLIEAVDRGELEIVKLLLQFKADVLFRELKHHQTALHLAVRKGHYAIVMELCKCEECQELLLLTDRNENNALHFAVSRDRKNGFRLVDFLINHGAEVDKVNARCQTPLVVHIMTTRQTDPAIAELFLERGADPCVPLADGSTLLHVAVERQLIDIACALLHKGASLNQPDEKGRLVVEIADPRYLKKLLHAIAFPPEWIDDKHRKQCMLCHNNFRFGNRKRHCYHCGRVCCSECANFDVELCRFPKDFPGRITANGKLVKDPQRVCRTCFAVFKMRAARKESKSGFVARVLGYEWDEITEV